MSMDLKINRGGRPTMPLKTPVVMNNPNSKSPWSSHLGNSTTGLLTSKSLANFNLGEEKSLDGSISVSKVSVADSVSKTKKVLDKILRRAPPDLIDDLSAVASLSISASEALTKNTQLRSIETMSLRSELKKKTHELENAKKASEITRQRLQTVEEMFSELRDSVSAKGQAAARNQRMITKMAKDNRMLVDTLSVLDLPPDDDGFSKSDVHNREALLPAMGEDKSAEFAVGKNDLYSQNIKLKESLLRISREHYRSSKSVKVMTASLEQLQSTLKAAEQKNRTLQHDLDELRNDGLTTALDSTGKEENAESAGPKVHNFGEFDEKFQALLERQAIDVVDSLMLLRRFISLLATAPITLLTTDIAPHIASKELLNIFEVSMICLYIQIPEKPGCMMKFTPRSRTPEIIDLSTASCLVKEIMKFGNPARFNSLRNISFNAAIDGVTGLRPQRVLSMPLKDIATGHAFGVIHFINKSYNNDIFTEGDELFASLFASQVESLLSHCHFYHRTKARAQLLSALLRSSVDLMSVMPSQDSLMNRPHVLPGEVLHGLETVVYNGLKTAKCRAFLVTSEFIGMEGGNVIFLEKSMSVGMLRNASTLVTKTGLATSGIVGHVLQTAGSVYQVESDIESDTFYNTEVDLDPLGNPMVTVAVKIPGGHKELNYSNGVVAVLQMVLGPFSLKLRPTADDHDGIGFLQACNWLIHQLSPVLYQLLSCITGNPLPIIAPQFLPAEAVPPLDKIIVHPPAKKGPPPPGQPPTPGAGAAGTGPVPGHHHHHPSHHHGEGGSKPNKQLEPSPGAALVPVSGGAVQLQQQPNIGGGHDPSQQHAGAEDGHNLPHDLTAAAGGGGSHEGVEEGTAAAGGAVGPPKVLVDHEEYEALKAKLAELQRNEKMRQSTGQRNTMFSIKGMIENPEPTKKSSKKADEDAKFLKFQLDQANSQLDQAKEQLQTAQETQEAAEKAKQQVEIVVDELRDDIAALKENEDLLVEQLLAKQQALEDALKLSETVERAEERLQKKEIEVEALRDAMSTLTEEKEKLKKDLDKSKKSLGKLQKMTGGDGDSSSSLAGDMSAKGAASSRRISGAEQQPAKKSFWGGGGLVGGGGGGGGGSKTPTHDGSVVEDADHQAVQALRIEVEERDNRINRLETILTQTQSKYNESLRSNDSVEVKLQAARDAVVLKDKAIKSLQAEIAKMKKANQEVVDIATRDLTPARAALVRQSSMLMSEDIQRRVDAVVAQLGAAAQEEDGRGSFTSRSRGSVDLSPSAKSSGGGGFLSGIVGSMRSSFSSRVASATASLSGGADSPSSASGGRRSQRGSLSSSRQAQIVNELTATEGITGITAATTTTASTDATNTTTKTQSDALESTITTATTADSEGGGGKDATETTTNTNANAAAATATNAAAAVLQVETDEQAHGRGGGEQGEGGDMLSPLPTHHTGDDDWKSGHDEPDEHSQELLTGDFVSATALSMKKNDGSSSSGGGNESGSSRRSFFSGQSSSASPSSLLKTKSQSCRDSEMEREGLDVFEGDEGYLSSSLKQTNEEHDDWVHDQYNNGSPNISPTSQGGGGVDDGDGTFNADGYYAETGGEYIGDGAYGGHEYGEGGRIVDSSSAAAVGEHSTDHLAAGADGAAYTTYDTTASHEAGRSDEANIAHDHNHAYAVELALASSASEDYIAGEGSAEGSFAEGSAEGSSSVLLPPAAAYGGMVVGDWVQYYDEASGAPYWINQITNESVWELPPDALSTLAGIGGSGSGSRSGLGTGPTANGSRHSSSHPGSAGAGAGAGAGAATGSARGLDGTVPPAGGYSAGGYTIEL